MLLAGCITVIPATGRFHPDFSKCAWVETVGNRGVSAMISQITHIQARIVNLIISKKDY